MFTGIIKSIGRVHNIIIKKNIYFLFIRTSKYFLADLNIGQSISSNGCCLTITNLYKNILVFNIIINTLNITTFKKVKIGDYLNLEKPLKIQDFIGGHIVTGHITGIAIINKIRNYIYYRILWIKPYDMHLMNYILEKGSICIDGVSLTIDKKLTNKFSVNIIPETLLKTTLSKKKINDDVNLEVDFYTKTIIETVKILHKNNNKYT
ncbi:riboflavin synthase [Enterobacteriaceae endosymbiont of Donacia tomentosa]|uniref:riboflavin synthase n=1 Tax=Enterobacteriaceae endosymbiont of Donacia tomentosa TaxID=2675787 RepID=UPI001448D7DC|nr:riboflavin synthase [Enterobacteriaceae endosymbiont of Donacia tomentosa]QJC31562.1 riboflavin synthase [Enterobacteriaceae endosymbiont of Donacia tomentosa]